MNESRFRIFGAGLPTGEGPPRPDTASPPGVLAPSPVKVRDDLLRAVSAILDAAPEVGEPVQRTFDRKEHELRTLFDEMEPVERATACARLAGADHDPVVAKLGRLSGERPRRLLARLAEAPRRRVK